jgi:hypothetical protein
MQNVLARGTTSLVGQFLGDMTRMTTSGIYGTEALTCLCQSQHHHVCVR